MNFLEVEFIGCCAAGCAAANSHFYSAKILHILVVWKIPVLYVREKC